MDARRTQTPAPALVPTHWARDLNRRSHTIVPLIYIAQPNNHNYTPFEGICRVADTCPYIDATVLVQKDSGSYITSM